MTQVKMPRDEMGGIIQTCRTFPAVQNESITSAAYTAITVPTGVSCKSVALKTRDGQSFRLATSATPTEYAKINGTITFNLYLNAGETAFYVRADSTSDTLEVIYLN